MGLARSAARGVLGHFTTDQAVRAGVATAAWSTAASYARGLLPRTPIQQAAATGVVLAAHYQVGATLWAGIASTAAGRPGSRPGSRALLTAAAVSAGGGKFAERQLRPHSSDSVMAGAAWSSAKLLSVVGLAGGLVTASDVVAHEMLGLPRSPTTTLALDLAAGGLMAAGTVVRRRRRTRTFAPAVVVAPDEESAAPRKRNALKQARKASYVAGVAVGTTVSLGGLAVGEQAAARQVSRGLSIVIGEDLGEFGDAVGHLAMFGAFGVAAYFGLRTVRVRIEQRSSKREPAYDAEPDVPYVSTGPNSAVAYESIGREGRRFVTMRLSAAEIETVMAEPAAEPVRVVIPEPGRIEDRVALAVAELAATGGIDRSLICVASPTGVGYVNYVLAEALEYLTRGDCAIVVPQYAYVPSALALDRTRIGTQLQRSVIVAIREELQRRGSSAVVVQFGESLGAQVAADVGGVRGIEGFDEVGLAAGLYLGVPFRSSLWRAYLRDPLGMSAGGRLVNTPDAPHLAPGSGRHVMVNHHDDPINKFAYTMVVQCPWWMGPGSQRPEMVPRETYFRPITTFVLAMVDVLNGMNMKPGKFRRVGHDYRIDIREALQKTFDLSAGPDQVVQIESALRSREQEWAERRLLMRNIEKIRSTINSWGRDAVNMPLDEQPEDLVSQRLVGYLSARLGRGGSGREELDAGDPSI